GISRRISDGAAEEGYPDRDRGELEDADPDRRRNEQQGPAIGANDRHLVGPRDEKVARESVGERSRHDDREKGGGERGIESENRERRHRADENDREDERGVRRRREKLQREVRGRVDQDHAQVGEDEGDEIGVQTVHGCEPFPGGNPSAFQAATTSSRPSANVGYAGCQRKSERNRALDVGKDDVRSAAVYRPSASRTSKRGNRRGGRVPSLVASAVTYSDRETGRSSTTCHTPDFGHSEAATKALAASSAWIQDQTAAPPSTRTGRPRTSDSPKTRVCHPSGVEPAAPENRDSEPVRRGGFSGDAFTVQGGREDRIGNRGR